MIDGIKIMNVPFDYDVILCHKYLDFVTHHSIKTGEERNYNKRTNYRGLDFTLTYDRKLKLQGSLHKYKNKGVHNYDDFSLSEIREAIHDLQHKFNIYPDKTHLNNVEFGINIQLPYSPKRFINSVINHKGEPFYPMSKAIIKKGVGIECKHDQYYIKIYDKGAQNNLPENILRIEIKVVRMIYFKNNGIELKTLTDFEKSEIYLKLKEKFLLMIDDLLVSIQYSELSLNLSEKEKLIHAEGTNPKYWSNLKPESTLKKTDPVKFERDRKKYYRVKTKFKALLGKHKLDEIKKEVKKLSKKKWDELINSDATSIIQKGDKFTDSKGDKFTGSKRTSSGQNHTIYEKVKCTPDGELRVYCKVTGVDISEQRKGSKFVNADKAGYLGAHRIRNADSDPRNNLKKRILKYKDSQTLFDMMDPELLKPTPEQIEILKPWKGTKYDIKLVQF